MTTRIQMSLFSNPGDGIDPSQGLFVPEAVIADKPPKVESNAIEKRNKRAAWYLSQCLKKNDSERSDLA